MRRRSPAGLFALLLTASLLPPAAYSQPRASETGEDFPPEDYLVWLMVERGLKDRAADLQLAKAPDSPETITLLLNADRIREALTVLRRIVERRPDRMAAAFEAASAHAHRFNDAGRGYPSQLRAIVATARQQVRGLTREQAAEVQWYVRFLDLPVAGNRPVAWADQLRALVAEYAGTEAALRAELTLLDQQGDLLARIAALETFARSHAGTAIGAQALHTAAMNVAVNVPITQVEPRGADPTERLLRVAALARELQSGAYPDCEWVRRAPRLVTEFFASEPRYAKQNVPRVVAVLREFLVQDLGVWSPNPLASGVGYLITNKLPVIFAAAGGEPMAQIDRFLLDLQAEVKHPAEVQYVRAFWYRHLAIDVKDPEQQDGWRRKADAALTDLARTGAEFYNRKALASLASLAFKEKNCDVAVERYREYLSRFPESGWAWVAALRIGQCEQSRGNWGEARAAYESVASRRSASPPALVFGHTFAGRASEALDDFDRARAAYERADRAWDQRFADPNFGAYQFYTRLDGETCSGCDPRSRADVTREWLRERAAQLKGSPRLSERALLERGRFLVTEGVWRNAVAPLEELIERYPDSPGAAEAHHLLTRAKLEMSLLQAGPDATDEARRAAAATLVSLTTEPYGFSVFAAQVARATLQSIVGSPAQAEKLMSNALTRWHEHGAALFAKRPATALQQDVMAIRDAVFDPTANPPRQEFRHLRSSDTPPPFFIVTPRVRVKLHDDSDVRVEAAARLAVRPGALLLDQDQIAVLERILTGLGGTRRRAPGSVMETPNQPIGPVQDIEKFWNRFFTMGPGHWGGWILETFPVVTEVTFIDAARTKGAARIRTGYQGSTQLLTKTDRTWKVTGSSGHWIE